MAKNKNNKNTPSECQKNQSCKDTKQENKKTNTPANESNLYTK